jgi:hypothetical protein
LKFLVLVGQILRIFSLETSIKHIFTGRSSIKFLHFILIGQNKWSPWAILVSDWLKFKKSSGETRRNNEILLCRGDV